ncbi:MAG: hypothetical protein JNM41_05960 [Flavipsychrobacter sp.]|nr:hypothetical protein [Flavipsychrobacter sp.]
MKVGILRSIIGSIAATAAMSIVMYVAPFMGLPKMNAAGMLSEMLHTSPMVGWLMHFMIGAILGVAYGQFLIKLLGRIDNGFIRGSVWGIVVFVFAQIMMIIMRKLMPMPNMTDNIVLMLMGSLIGHVIWGIVAAATIRPKRESSSSLL